MSETTILPGILAGLDGLEVHPAADLFPLMGEEELAALAEDIKENGLLQPIVLDESGKLLDGRNRLKACQMAGVTPRFQTMEGDDPVALSISLNVKRRKALTQSQRAVVAAHAWELYRTPRKSADECDSATTFGGRTVEKLSHAFEVSAAYIQRARFLVKHAPQSAADVSEGRLYVDDAYTKARQTRLAEEQEQKDLARIRAEHPDLAQQVDAGTLSLAAAKREADERDERLRISKAVNTRNLLTGIRMFDQPTAQEHIEKTIGLLDEQTQAQQDQYVTADALRRVSAFIVALIEGLERTVSSENADR